ncbi:MAG: glycosyltransferase [Thermodesulfobacteriota bacterium]
MNETIRLTYLVDFFRTVQAGTETQLAHLLTHLPRTGYRIHLLSFQDSPFLQETAPKMFPEIAITTLGARADMSKSLFSLWRLYRILRDTRPNMVHTFFHAANSLGVMIARVAGVRQVISSRRDMAFNITSRDLVLLRIADRFVSCVICNARAVRNKAMQSEGLREDKTRIIYNGIAVENYSPSDRICQETAPVIGIVANLNREVKRVDLFIQAAAMVHQSHPRARFWVVGDGHLRAGLEKLARESGLQSAIQFWGRRADVPTLLKEMSIGVICSDSEGFSNAVMEYMAAGLAVITTDSGGAGEIIRHGQTGMLVAPGDAPGLVAAIRRMLDEPDAAADLARAGHAAVHKQFSVERMLQETDTVYRNLMLS